MISPKLLQATRERYQRLNQELPVKIDLDRDVLKPLVDEGHIFAYDTTEYIKDMGTPDRYYEVEHDVMAGIVKARNLKQKQRAVFLDRDGTINEYVGFLSSAEQFKLIEGTAEAIRQINKSGYLAIVITNQPVIARGDCTFEQLRQIHDKMETELGKSGAYVDAIYVCPHHPDTGFEGERREYKKVCSCRKPNIGLLLQAEQDFHIDLGRSFIIGDSMRDVEAGRNAGLKDSLLIQKNQEGQLMEAVQTIIKKNEQ
jgi:D,D-heptose 1,7-bisphosphate phosphatase